MQYLPAELISDILSRLSVKDLIHCTSVSKLWNSIVHSKLFIREHNQRAITSNNDCTLIYSSYSNDDLSSLAFSACSDTFSNDEPLKHPIYSAEERDQLRLHTNVITACNGLILLEVIRNYCSTRMTKGKSYLFLWNPMIAKHKKIPYEARTWKPGLWTQIYGLGYLSDEDDVKVLCFVQQGGFVDAGGVRSKLTSKLKVYSLASGTWKMIEKLPPGNLQFGLSFCRMVWFNNSCVAWLMSDADNHASRFVLTFDLLKEEYHAFPIPVEVNNVPCDQLFALGGSLCYWLEGHDSTTVWIMKDSSWSMKLSFKMNMCHPLFFDGERFLLMLKFYDKHCSSYGEEVVWYTVKTQERATKTCRFAGRITNITLSVGCLRLLLDGDPDGRINYFGAPLT